MLFDIARKRVFLFRNFYFQRIKIFFWLDLITEWIDIYIIIYYNKISNFRSFNNWIFSQNIRYNSTTVTGLRIFWKTWLFLVNLSPRCRDIRIRVVRERVWKKQRGQGFVGVPYKSFSVLRVSSLIIMSRRVEKECI